uniref:RAB5 interacting factor n=1 Tax=Gouania willdenowi TaxID=441366 RepID=A0A8C5E784_GOUWI
MMSSSKRKEESQLANGGVKQSTWSKALSSNAVWDEKDEFLDVIYWLRQIIAVILGLIWGVAPLKGFLGIAIFCIINAGVLYVYFSSFQQIDEEEYGGTWELTKEGFMTSFALFLVHCCHLHGTSWSLHHSTRLIFMEDLSRSVS